MDTIEKRNLQVKVYIKHTKPIEVVDFIKTMEGLSNLYSDFAKDKAEVAEIASSKLYVEKIEEGSIILYLTELVSASLLPMMENSNIIFDFTKYICEMYQYYIHRKGEKPQATKKELSNLSDILSITAKDENSTIAIGAVNKTESGNIYNNCLINNFESNAGQNILRGDIKIADDYNHSCLLHKRVLMKIYQVRSDLNTDTGNKAIVDEISAKKLALLFESDEIKERILHTTENPLLKGFFVDVEVKTIEGKPKAYNVVAFHDVIDIE